MRSCKFTLPFILSLWAIPADAGDLKKGDRDGASEQDDRLLVPHKGPQRIVQGDVTSDWPATAALMDGSEQFCTGTLVEPNVVLTAGHCLEDGPPTHVYFGDEPGTGGTEVSTRGIRIHEQYGYDRDIGIIFLDRNVPGIEPVHIDDTPAEQLIGQEIIYVGYGTTEGTGGEGLKKEATATVTDVEGDVLVVNPENGSACYGDSGGPLYRYASGGQVRVAGVVSFGYTDDCMDLGGNTRTDVYVDWIAGAIGDGPDADWEEGLEEGGGDTGDWNPGQPDGNDPVDLPGDTGFDEEPQLGCAVAAGPAFGWLLMLPALALLRRRQS